MTASYVPFIPSVNKYFIAVRSNLEGCQTERTLVRVDVCKYLLTWKKNGVVKFQRTGIVYYMYVPILSLSAHFTSPRRGRDRIKSYSHQSSSPSTFLAEASAVNCKQGHVPTFKPIGRSWRALLLGWMCIEDGSTRVASSILVFQVIRVAVLLKKLQVEVLLIDLGCFKFRVQRCLLVWMIFTRLVEYSTAGHSGSGVVVTGLMMKVNAFYLKSCTYLPPTDRLEFNQPNNSSSSDDNESSKKTIRLHLDVNVHIANLRRRHVSVLGRFVWEFERS